MSYVHFTASERRILDNLLRLSWSLRAIARAMKRSPSSISRELRRNSDKDGYNPHLANLQYWERREQKYVKYKTGDEQLMACVIDKLKEGWSPEQIDGRFRHEDYPNNKAMWISYESVYRYIWDDKRKGGTLHRYLRHSRRKYRKRGTGSRLNRQFPGRVSIKERPAIVAEQGRFGDWEADTLYGRQRESSIVTIVERKSLFCAAAHTPGGTASSVNQGLLHSLLSIPKQILLTITVDNGKEWTSFKEIETRLNTSIYFARPYRAWERGINENLNGLLRQYLPRGTDLSSTTTEGLEQIVKRMNDRPRKKLKYRTPNEVFSEACVALDT